jgi:predicted Zn-dependent peptidase
LKNAKSITPEIILDVHRKHYVPHKMVLIVAGQNTTNIVKYIQRWFSRNQSTTEYIIPKLPKTIYFKPPVMKENYHWIDIIDVEQHRIRITFRLPFLEFNSLNKRIALAVAYILSESVAARLYMKLRQDLGLIYYNKTTVTLDEQDAALSTLSIETSTDPKNSPVVLKAMLEIVLDVQQHGLTRKEWYDEYGTNFQLSLVEKTLDTKPQRYIDDYYNNFVWRNRVETNRQRQLQFKSIDLKDVNDQLKQWLDLKHTLILVGGIKEIPKLSTVIK